MINNINAKTKKKILFKHLNILNKSRFSNVFKLS